MIHDRLRPRRAHRWRSLTATAPPRASTASRSTRPPAASTGGGFDNVKNVDGRKRHIVVESMGLLTGRAGQAETWTTQAAQNCSPGWRGNLVGKVVRVFADSKYHNYELYEWVEANARWDWSIVRRPEGSEGWVRLPIRWTVERTFAWLGRCRRLTKDREKSVRRRRPSSSWP